MEEKELKEAIASYMKDPVKREALAEIVVEWAQPGHLTMDVVNMLLNTRSLQPGSSLIKKVRKGIKVFTHVMGQIPLKSEITVTERMNYVLDTAIVSVTANEQELESGELGTVESIVGEMQAKFRDYYVNKVFTGLATVWNAVNTPDNFTDVGTDITQLALDNAINQINESTPGVKAIVGTRAALTPIMKFSAWTNDGTNYAASDERITRLLKEGWLGEYLGAPLVLVKQEYDYPDDYNKMVPEDKILVIGENVGEFITYGDVKRQEYTDMRPVPPQWNVSVYQQFGFMLDNVNGIHVLKVA